MESSIKHIKFVRIIIVEIVILSLTYYLASYWKNIGHNIIFDDAFMFTRYAKHWLAGNSFSWNPTEGPSYGITSPLYLFIVTIAKGTTSFPDNLILNGISFAAGLVSCLVLITLGFLFRENWWVRETWLPLLVVPSLIFTSVFGFHSNTGMETTLSLLANSILACCVVIWSRHHSRLTFATCIFSGYIAYLTRPDNGLYALLLPPLYLLATNYKLWRQSLLYTLLFILILLSDLGLKQALFGSTIPLPFFAKSNGFYLGYLGTNKWNAMVMMTIFWNASLPFTIIIINLLTRKTFTRLTAIAIPIIATFTYYATMIQIMGWPARYYYPTLPFFVLGAFVVLDSYYEEVTYIISIRQTLKLRILLSLIALLPITTQFKNVTAHFWETNVIGSPIVFSPKKNIQRHTKLNLPQLGTWESINAMDNLLKQLPQGTNIAATEYGFIGSELPNMTIIDLIGLHDSNIAHNGFTAKYIFLQGPDIIWFPHQDYSFIIATMLNSDEFTVNYDYYPGAFDYGIAIRKTSPKFESIKVIVEKEFTRIYHGLKMSDYKAEIMNLP